MQHILLFGGGGFVGAHLAPLLKKNGGADVMLIDRDIPLQSAHLDADVVVVMTQPGSAVKEVLLPALARGNAPSRIVYLSSLLVYPDSPVPQSETTAPAPLTSYEKGKCEEERLLSEIVFKRGITLSIARLGNLYGDVQNRGVINELFLSALIGKTFVGYGGFQKIVRDYLFIDDAVGFLGRIILTPPTSQKEIFNLCTGNGATLAEVIEAVRHITNTRIAIVARPPKGEKLSSIGDPAKFFLWSGLRPRFTLAQGLRKTYENYRKLYTEL